MKKHTTFEKLDQMKSRELSKAEIRQAHKAAKAEKQKLHHRR